MACHNRFVEAAEQAETDSSEPSEFVHSCGVAFRPCPYTECRHSLVEIRRQTWTSAMPHVNTADSCSLDVAQRCEDRGFGESLDEVGARLGITKERVRQIEEGALLKLRPVMEQISGGEIDG